jgi:hypothetical protein
LGGFKSFDKKWKWNKDSSAINVSRGNLSIPEYSQIHKHAEIYGFPRKNDNFRKGFTIINAGEKGNIKELEGSHSLFVITLYLHIFVCSFRRRGRKSPIFKWENRKNRGIYVHKIIMRKV